MENIKEEKQKNNAGGVQGYDLYQVRSERKGERAATEIALEKSVIGALKLMDDLIKDFKDEDFILPTTLVNDYRNPTKEEINKELNRITALMIYFSEEKSKCQVLVSNKEAELDYYKAVSRDECKRAFDKEREQWLSQMLGAIDTSAKSTMGVKLVPTLKSLIEKAKPSQPTEKDYEAFLNKNKNIIEIKQDYNILVGRLARFTDMSYIINKRFSAVMELSKQLYGTEIADKQYARNN